MASPAGKTRRQQAVIDVVRTEVIESQDDLLRALRRRGIRVTQATLSRDLHELRIARAPTEDGYRYRLPGDETLAPAAEAQPGEVLVTEDVASAASDGAWRFEPAGEQTLKGIAEPVRLFRAATAAA